MTAGADSNHWWCRVCSGSAAPYVTAGAGHRRGLAHVGRSPKPGCRSNRVYINEFMALTLISIAQPRICERRNSTLPPRTSRCQAETARCVATRRLARAKMEAFDANSEDVVYEFVGLLLVNNSSREHCVVIHAKKQNFSVKSRALSLLDAVKTHFMIYSVRSQPPKRRWRDAECNFRR